MSFSLTPHPHETIVASSSVPALRPWLSNTFRFGFVITSEALYVPVPKPGLALAESLESRRIPLSDVRSLSIRPARDIPAFLVANLALIALWLVFLLPKALASAGLLALAVLPLALLPGTIRTGMGLRGRSRLILATSDGQFEFTPTPFEVPLKHQRERALRTQTAFLESCSQLGVPIKEGSSFEASRTPA